MKFYELCLKEVKRIRKTLEMEISWVNRTNNKIMASIKVDRTYLSKSKGELVSNETYKKIYNKLQMIDTEKIYQSLK